MSQERSMESFNEDRTRIYREEDTYTQAKLPEKEAIPRKVVLNRRVNQTWIVARYNACLVA